MSRILVFLSVVASVTLFMTIGACAPVQQVNGSPPAELDSPRRPESAPPGVRVEPLSEELQSALAHVDPAGVAAMRAKIRRYYDAMRALGPQLDRLLPTGSDPEAFKASFNGDEKPYDEVLKIGSAIRRHSYPIGSETDGVNAVHGLWTNTLRNDLRSYQPRRPEESIAGLETLLKPLTDLGLPKRIVMLPKSRSCRDPISPQADNWRDPLLAFKAMGVRAVLLARSGRQEEAQVAVRQWVRLVMACEPVSMLDAGLLAEARIELSRFATAIVEAGIMPPEAFREAAVDALSSPVELRTAAAWELLRSYGTGRVAEAEERALYEYFTYVGSFIGFMTWETPPDFSRNLSLLDPRTPLGAVASGADDPSGEGLKRMIDFDNVGSDWRPVEMTGFTHWEIQNYARWRVLAAAGGVAAPEATGMYRHFLNWISNRDKPAPEVSSLDIRSGGQSWRLFMFDFPSPSEVGQLGDNQGRFLAEGLFLPVGVVEQIQRASLFVQPEVGDRPESRRPGMIRPGDNGEGRFIIAWLLLPEGG